MAESKKYVVDASVILKWTLDELEDAAQAKKLLEDAIYERCVLYGAEHTYVEVANILARHEPEYALVDLTYVFDEGLVLLLPHSALMVKKSFEIMKKYSSVSYYDASYHALAIVNKSIFITADEKYYRQTKAFGHSMLLKDYPV